MYIKSAHGTYPLPERQYMHTKLNLKKNAHSPTYRVIQQKRKILFCCSFSKLDVCSEVSLVFVVKFWNVLSLPEQTEMFNLFKKKTELTDLVLDSTLGELALNQHIFNH